MTERTPKPRIVEPSRRQGVMRFEMPEDVVPAEHPVRVLDRVVGPQGGAGRRGQPGTHPRPAACARGVGPATAIRNGDLDGNAATERDPSWTPFIDTPMHPEYPCAHCIVSSAVATVLRAEIGAGPTPTLTTTSPTAGGASRSWTSLDDFVREVAEARICDGVHYRNSTDVGVAMGRRVGELAVAKVLRGRN